MTGFKRSLLSIAALTLAQTLFAAGAEDAAFPPVTLLGETSKPQLNIFIPGEEIFLDFKGVGLGKERKQMSLQVSISDEFGRKLEERPEIPLKVKEDGSWSLRVPALNKGFGFYRVEAKLTNGTTLPAIGTRPAGFLSYCVVADPRERKLYDAKDTFFGMQGGIHPLVNIMPYLGVRWQLDNKATWEHLERNKLGSFAEKWRKSKDQRADGTFPPKPIWWQWWGFGVKYGYYPPGGDPWTLWRTYPVLAGLCRPDRKWDEILTVPRTRTTIGTSGALTPEGELHFRNYCHEIALATADYYPEDSEHLYEVTWELGRPWAFSGTLEQHVRIYEIAYEELHAADPKAFVIGPCMANIGLYELNINTCKPERPVYQALFERGLGKYIDGFSVHAYWDGAKEDTDPEQAGLLEYTTTLREIIRKYAGREMPMFVTEMGCRSFEDAKRELPQARNLVRANLILLGERWRFCCSFIGTDYLSTSNVWDDRGYGLFHSLDFSDYTDFNWRRGSRVSPKPVAPAYAAMSFLLEGHKGAGSIDCLAGKSVGYVYEAPGDAVMALWDWSGTPHEATIPVGVDKVDVYDWMGNCKSVATLGGALKLLLGKEPVYIKGFSPQLWGAKAQKAIAFSNRRIGASPGQMASTSVTVRAPAGKPLAGLLQLEGETELKAKAIPVDIAPGGKEDFTLDVEVDPEASYGAKQPLATLKSGEAMLAATSLQVDVKPPLEVVSSMPSFKESVASVETVLEEKLGRPSKGMLKLDIGGSSSSIAYSLAANERKSFELPVDAMKLSPLKRYEMKLKVAPDDAAFFESKGKMNFLLAKQLTKAPSLKGDLSEWSNLPFHEIKGKSWVVRSAKYFKDEKDCSAKLRYAWDDQNLYFVCEATYRNFIQNQTGADTWKDNCIQLDIDLDPFKEGQESSNALLNVGLVHRCTEIDLAFTKNGQEAYRTESYDCQKLPMRLLDAKELPLSIKRTDNADGSTTLFYEAAIPWRSLGAEKAPGSGESIGMSAALNYRNDVAQDDPCALGIFALKNPAYFGYLLLE